MGKGNSRKKQDRAKAASRRAEQERRRAKVARQRQAAEQYAQLTDPSASPARVAEILAAHMPDRILAADMVRVRMALGVPASEVAETARLLFERAAPGPPGIGALAVAALAAHLAGDEDAEHGHVRDLLARTDASRDPGQWLDVIRSATDRDHPGETCELIEPYLREHPDDEVAADVYARALAKAQGQAEPGALETAALDRYRDRSELDALDRAVNEFVERTRWGAIIAAWVGDERAELKTEHWQAAERDTTDAVMAEVAILFPLADKAGDVEEGGDEVPDTPLRAFAAAPETPAELASRAIERDEHLRYGIWQVANSPASPGAWCTDLVSGTRRYVQFPATVIDDEPPWSVWLGALAPSGGIWRATGTGIWLSPIEGDALAEYTEDAAWHMLDSLLGEHGDYPPVSEQPRFGQAEPYCVRWDTAQEVEPEFGEFVTPVVARLAPRLLSWVWRKRAEGVLLRNTDDEPLVLIEAAVTVNGDVAERLLARSDFGEEEDGLDGEIVWWGGLIDAEEQVVLGRLMPEPGRVSFQVNSESRLKRLLRILKEIGGATELAEQSRSRPSVDFAWGPVPGDELAARLWAESWLDQPVAVLEFHTPRFAAQGGEAERLRLEGLLRQLEYQSALPAERGGRPVDTAWLRAELGLESKSAFSR